MRVLLAMSFWVGVALTITELHNARKDGTPISRTEKVNLFFGVTLVFVVMVIASVVGMEPESAGASGGACIAAVFNVWGLKQRIRRKMRKAVKPSAARANSQIADVIVERGT